MSTTDEASILSAIAKLEEKTVRSRSEGLDDLRRILGPGRSPRIDELSDDAFHKILETLFRILKPEKQNYIRTARETARSTSIASRLTHASAALRLVVEVATRRFKHRTVIAVLDHVVDTLPTSDGVYCEPIEGDYLKTFRRVLGHPTHVEHLLAPQWQKYVDFILQGLRSNLTNAAEDNSEAHIRQGSMMSRNSLNVSLRMSQTSNARGSQGSVAGNAESLLGALTSLTSNPNAPLVSRMAEIINMTVDWIRRMSRAQDLAFECLNNLLPLALNEDISLVAAIFKELGGPICDLWTSNPSTLKDQMLITLFLFRHLYLHGLTGVIAVPADLLDQLISTIWVETENQAERDLLQVDDLDFADSVDSPPLSLKDIRPVSDADRISSAWITLSVLADLIIALDRHRHHHEEIQIDGNQRKRRRLENSIEDVFHRATTATGQARLLASQMALFIVDHMQDVAPRLVEYLDEVQNSLNDDDPNTASWTFLILARCVHVQGIVHSEIRTFWLRVWTVASRALNNVACYRSACHLIKCMLQSSSIQKQFSADLICDSFWSDGRNGPSLLTDASILALVQTLQCGVLDNERSRKHFASRVLSWLDSHWLIPTAPDRRHTVQTAAHGQPYPLYRLLSLVIGSGGKLIPPRAKVFLGVIHRAAYIDLQDTDFVRSMLSDELTTAATSKTDSSEHYPLGISQQIYLPARTVEQFISAKLRSFGNAWDALAETEASNVKSGIVKIAATLCIVAAQLQPELNTTNFDVTYHVLWQRVCQVCSQQRGEDLNVLTNGLTDILLQLHGSDTQVQHSIVKNRQVLIDQLLSAVTKPSTTQITTALDTELLESYDSITSQSSHVRGTSLVEDIRRDLPCPHDLESSIVRSTFLLKCDRMHVESDGVLDADYMASFVRAISCLDASQLLKCRSTIQQVLDKEFTISRSDASQLLERIASVCLENDGFARCEAVLCLCLRLLTSLANLWKIRAQGDPDRDDLDYHAFEIYKWYVTKIVGKNVASPRVLQKVALLLEAILKSNPIYRGRTIMKSTSTDREKKLESPQSILLEDILQVGPSILKFRIAPQLSYLFDGHVLSDHGSIFDTIVGNLPSDLDNQEGIWVRLYILAYLGSRWHTVLRQAVYYILETTANVPTASKIGRKCVEMMCNKLGLDGPTALFRLFSAQLLYTWLEKESVDAIPYDAFGYGGLADLLRDVREEVVAQVVMRASQEHAQRIVHYLGMSWDGLIEQSFPRVIAYSIISDISIERPRREIGRAEHSVLEHLGELRYGSLLSRHFPEALGIVMLRLSDDLGFERAFGDHGDDFILALKKMRQYSSSETVLPPEQQPNFRAKYLLHILNKLSSHAQVSLKQLWTSSNLTHVYRVLLDDATPAFGPLHACATLRKVRLIVSLAGPAALVGFPLEMLLHTLRPFLTHFHCSQDAIGLVWFLLEHGNAHLAKRLSFLVGLGATVFASVARFVTMTQDSTTQESQFTSTIAKARAFQEWLGQYLSNIDTSSLGSGAGETFVNIVSFAKGITATGKNLKSPAEGSLLYHLIKDQSSDHALLSRSSFHYLLQVLCQEFHHSSDQSDDVLANIEDLTGAVPVLWTILCNTQIQGSLRTWTAQTIGRACARFGPHSLGWALEGNIPRHTLGQAHLASRDSYAEIIAVLTEQVWGHERSSASISEQTLQSIFSAITESEKELYFSSKSAIELYHELRFSAFDTPRLPRLPDDQVVLTVNFRANSFEAWASKLGVELCARASKDSVLPLLSHVLLKLPSIATRILPSIVHLSLSAEIGQHQTAREYLSAQFSEILRADDLALNLHATLILNIITYLRRCSYPGENKMSQREYWLNLDFQEAARAACRCGTYRDALLLLEISASHQAGTAAIHTRRASSVLSAVPHDLLSEIYRQIDDPDHFYGMIQGTDIMSLVTQLYHEGSGQTALTFQSALLDSEARLQGLDAAASDLGSSTVAALSLANLHGLANIVSRSTSVHASAMMVGMPIESSLNLQQWDITQHGMNEVESVTISEPFRTLTATGDLATTLKTIDVGILELSHGLIKSANRHADLLRQSACLAVLSELKETLNTRSFSGLEQMLQERSKMATWFGQASFEGVEWILLGREAVFAIIKNDITLQKSLKLTPQQSSLLEINTLRASLSTGREHEISQFCLNRAAYMSALIPSAAEKGLQIEVAIKHDLASTLWTQGQTTASIGILQQLCVHDRLQDQAITVSRADILTDLGRKLTQARLDRPDEVTSKYLQPAIKSLGKETSGASAGRVYHNFAAFCDQQLSDPDNLDEFNRIAKLRNRKKQEVMELEAMKASKQGRERDQLRGHLIKAKTWFNLDEQEWRRLRKYRENLVSHCLENYLRAMRACDDFPNDVLRFLALWLEHSQDEDASAMVAKHLSTVPSHKFAPLMNQLSSRILNTDDIFQRILFDLMFRICNDHPYHSLYQVFATSKSSGQKNDTIAASRTQAAKKLTETVRERGSAGGAWISIHNSNVTFVRVAQDKAPDRELKAGSKIQLRKLSMGPKLEQTIQDLHQKIPPPTMNIRLRTDCDYSAVATLTKFDGSITIAGGVSAPKIITAIASDGSRHKMLLKGGNDDLRQDSIMEQVFEQVSNLLKDHRATRQRKLAIRTYKVIPLTHNAGIIEFVRDTLPLHDYVLPAHQRHFPKDFRASRCRKEIQDAQTKSPDERLKAYQNVTAHFHPVMRFFFMEHFVDPNEWFQKRLSYSRSTAAVSILGHVLGLGDRHGHNILLDTNTGEVVHIDLGVAFEAGRVLPVPEVVPFRLTRDLVDAMGISGVEGVFRRCCNFTLEALREDQEAIMTILDVLRWDPLYSWSVSPLRLQRMQENQEQAVAVASTDGSGIISSSDDANNNQTTANTTSSRREGGLTTATTITTVMRQKSSEAMRDNEPSEADRALAIVAKKLGKSLSVEATVNDLIRQATDERNLAVLYCGWAAYA